jgi:hypothetical protein
MSHHCSKQKVFFQQPIGVSEMANSLLKFISSSLYPELPNAVLARLFDPQDIGIFIGVGRIIKALNGLSLDVEQ